MKNKKKTITIGLVFLVLFFSATVALAQEDSAINSNQEAIVLATVNIDNAKIISRDGNDFKISFDLSNSRSVQPDVRYGVQVIREEGNKKSVVYKNIYEEVLSLPENYEETKQIDFSLPSFIKGAYKLELVVANTAGLEFASKKLGEINAENSGEYIEIAPENCSLLFDDGSKKIKYPLDYGVDVGLNEQLFFVCKINSYYTKDVEAIVSLTTFWRNMFGNKISEENGENLKIIPGESETGKININKTSKPQAYDLVFQLKDKSGKAISNQVVFHYVIQGPSATIQNIRSDKNSYAKNETANIYFNCTSSADSYAGSRSGGTKIEKANVEIDIVDGKKNKCSSTIVKEITPTANMENINFQVPITKDCPDPIAQVRIKDGDNVLDGRSFVLFSRKVGQFESEKISPETILKIFIALICVLCFLIVAFIIAKGKGARSLKSFMILAIALSGIVFFGSENAQADTFYVPGGDFGTAVYQVQSTRRVNVGENLNIYGEANKTSVCDNGGGDSFARLLVDIQVPGYQGERTLFDWEYFGEGGPEVCYMQLGELWCYKTSLSTGSTTGSFSIPLNAPPGNYKVVFRGFAGFRNWNYGIYERDLTIKCNQPPMTTPSYWISNTEVGTGEDFTVTCNYGVVTNAISATVGGGTCSFNRFDGTSAIFNCTAGKIPATRTIRCVMNSVSPAYYCAGKDIIGTINVVGNNSPTARVEYPSSNAELDRKDASIEKKLEGIGTDPEGSIIKHQWFLKRCDADPVTGEMVCNCNEDPDMGEATCTGSPKYFSDVNDVGTSSNIVDISSLLARTDPYIFYYRVRDNDGKWSAFDKVSFKIIKTNLLEVSVSPLGSGRVTSEPSGIDCSGTSELPGCSHRYSDEITAVRLSAASLSGYSFKNWTINGSSSVTGNPRQITLSNDKSVVANFEADSADSPCIPNNGYCEEHEKDYCLGTNFPEDNCNAYICEGKKDCREWKELGP